MSKKFSFMLLLIGFFICVTPAVHAAPGFGQFPGQNKQWVAPRDIKTPDLQWNGYCPPCTLSKPLCASRPCQTKNLLGPRYNGIHAIADQWMLLANQAALASVKTGGGPFGAVILQIDDKTGKVIRYWVNHNRVVKNSDPTAHAEISTIREAAKALGTFNLGHIAKEKSHLSQPSEWSHCIIYSSSEPCPMCLSAIYWAGIPKLYFAATRFDAAQKGVNFSDAMIYDELKKSYVNRTHMTTRQLNTNNSLSAFNYYKRSPVARYGEKPKD